MSDLATFNVLHFVTRNEERTAKEAAGTPEGEPHYSVLDVDIDTLYSETLVYLAKNQHLFVQAANASTAQLVTAALQGDWVAAFVVRSPQVAKEVASVEFGDWELANIPRDAVSDTDTLAKRNLALETARRFFTEALHQTWGEPILLHIIATPETKARWRL